MCGSLKVTLVLSDDPRAECERCHATWIQDGASQREVRKPPERAGGEKGFDSPHPPQRDET